MERELSMATDASELRPCEYCREHIHFSVMVDPAGRGYFVVCRNCAKCGPLGETYDEARRLWNTRAGETERRAT